jgi:hypothetical protein
VLRPGEVVADGAFLLRGLVRAVAGAGGREASTLGLCWTGHALPARRQGGRLVATVGLQALADTHVAQRPPGPEADDAHAETLVHLMQEAGLRLRLAGFGRIAHLLSRLALWAPEGLAARRSPLPTDAAAIPLGQSTLADACGLSRRHVHAALKALEREELLLVGHGRFVLRQVGAWRALARLPDEVLARCTRTPDLLADWLRATAAEP